LRQKLGEQGRRICTIRGVGYRFGFENGDPDLPES
jgi:DNA-binding response OmpR family regulator